MGHKIVVIGAGPAGLTAALELQAAGERDITVVEAGNQVGGISRTINYKGNRIDIGGHRFFSKSDWVMRWWTDILPLSCDVSASNAILRYRGQDHSSALNSRGVASDAEGVMLLRRRLSRIYYNRQFFDYPLALNIITLRKLGLVRTISFGLSYLKARLMPIRPETTLEDFLINRFGSRLYHQFFKEYSEKVWGVPCSKISASWGAQRIKSLSIGGAIFQAMKRAFGIESRQAARTSLIESFIYPRYGPGQMWEAVAKRFEAGGGKLLMNCTVDRVTIEAGQVRRVSFADGDGDRREIGCTHVVSTMPIKDLVLASRDAWAEELIDIASRLPYRDFITVGLLYRADDLPRVLEDNWIYIQEPGVLVGRVQVFNNWSPFMVAAANTIWLGLEYFCREADSLWSMADGELSKLAQREMRLIGLATADAMDSVVIRVPKAYPGYFGDAFTKFDRIRSALDAVDNLFLVGRNGMHRYNNQDHSMLTAREAAKQIVSGRVDKAKIWDINIGDEYQEEGDLADQR